MIYRPHHAFSHHEAVPNQFRTPGSFLVSRGGSLLESAEDLDRLRPLGAVDFVDVQSFIWVSCGGWDNDKSTAKRAPETVLKVASEGGGLQLLREKQKDNNYQFWTERDETTMSELLDDDDLVGVGDLFSRSSRVDSLDEAFRELDRYPWHRFYPSEVHPDLRVEVLREVRRKGGDTEEKRWKAALKGI
jgi:hypothetical protein